MKQAYKYSVEEVIKKVNSHSSGLEKKEAKERLSKNGPNKINQEDANHPLIIFLRQFKSGLIYVLIVAGVIAAIFGKWIDAYVIMGIILGNSILGFVQEYKAERAIASLMEMIVSTTKVLREGELLEVPTEHLVVGDVVLLEEGDKVPADMRIIKTKNFRTREASLTGESSPKGKNTEKIESDASLGDRKNMVWMGTFVAEGSAKCMVVATGNDTVFGKIAEDMEDIDKGGGHFEERISILAKQMAVFAFSGAALIFLISIIKSGIGLTDGIEAFEEPLFASIAALVSGIPEGLPAIAIIVLAVGATRMAKRNAVIRKLSATETLGVADHILSDKTGTITQNTMTVKRIVFPETETVTVSGEGWEPKGKFYRKSEMISPLEDPDLDKLLHIAEICNKAELSHEEDDKENCKIIGDPTEGGLVVLAEKAGLRKDVVAGKEEKLDDMPFSSKLKMRASLIKIKEDKEIYVVGAPEAIVEKSSETIVDGKIVKLNKERKGKIVSKINEMSDEAMRTIALAYRKVSDKTDQINERDINDLVLVGVVGMIDPPKPGVQEAVEKAKQAGIRVIMVTGDHKNTAAAIAKKVGIAKEEKGKYPVAMDQSDLERISEVEFRDKVKHVNVFSRLTPHMKLKIAKTLQEEGAIIAMTGDGVNDAPAVKQADIGISMGIMGTDVTREAGDIVLTDDNFASIVNAIEEGRIVFENTRKASSSLITSNFGEIGTIITSIILGFPLPILPTQILWVNLVTDGVMGIPLVLEPGHGDILKSKPRDKDENILTKEILPYFVIMMVLMAGIAIFIFDLFYEGGANLTKARTGAFSVIAFTQLFNAVNLRSIDKSIFKIGLFSNKFIIMGFLLGVFLQMAVIMIPGLREVFQFETLSLSEIGLIALLSSSVFWVGELYKRLRYGRN